MLAKTSLRFLKRGALMLLLAMVFLPGSSLDAQSVDETIQSLQLQLRELQELYEARIAALEARVQELESVTAEPAEDPLARLRSLAEEAAAQAQTPAPAEPTVGRGAGLNRLNPEISATGVLLASGSSQAREDLRAQEVELDLQSSLDPFSRMRLTLAFNDEGEAEVEEGYVHYGSMPGGLGLTVGRFRQPFGPLNRQHLHALPQTDYPLVYQSFFGEEGLAQSGLSLEWLLPHPWASASEITIQLTDGANDAFGGEDFEHLTLLAHVKSYWDLSAATWFEWGLSGAAGDAPGGGSSSVVGTDLTLHWQPPARAKTRELTWRTELLRSQRDDELGGSQLAWGGYTYLEAAVGQNLSLGLRYDRAEEPWEPARSRWAVVPYVTWWQSEYVRLRGELRRVVHRPSDAAENQVALQLVWAAGPHKHETY